MEVESVVSDVEAQPRVAPLDPPGGGGHDRLVGTGSSIWIVLLHPSIHPSIRRDEHGTLIDHEHRQSTYVCTLVVYGVCMNV